MQGGKGKAEVEERDKIPRRKKNLTSIWCTSDADLGYQLVKSRKVPDTVKKLTNKNCCQEELC